MGKLTTIRPYAKIRVSRERKKGEEIEMRKTTMALVVVVASLVWLVAVGVWMVTMIV